MTNGLRNKVPGQYESVNLKTFQTFERNMKTEFPCVVVNRSQTVTNQSSANFRMGGLTLCYKVAGVL